jgi:hypothetical protein
MSQSCPANAREVAKIAALMRVMLADLVKQAIAAEEGARATLIEATADELAGTIHEAMTADIVAAVDDGIAIGKRIAAAEASHPAHPGADPAARRQPGEPAA